jgi:spermidine/putrescine transport system substrate-binding protein
MEKNEFIDKLCEGRLTRRDFNKALAATGLALVSVPMATRAPKAASEDHPVCYAWAGYEVPEMHKPYFDKYGESPNFALWGDEEEAFAKMRAGFKPDVSMPCSYKVTQWNDAGFLQPIDVGRLSNWKDVLPDLKNVPDTSFDGKQPWVCAWWGLTSITYRTDLVDIEEESWGLLWDKRYAGRLSMIDSLIDGVMVAAIYSGAKNPFDMTKDEVAVTKKLLEEQRSLLRFYTNDMTTVEQALASGELVAATTWNSSITGLTKQGLPVKFMQPKEGPMTWTCGIALHAGVEDDMMDRAYDLIDAFLAPETGEYWIKEYGMGHSNAKAFERVSSEELTVRGLSDNPGPYIKAGIFQATIRNEPELQAMFEEVKAGL